MLSPRRSGLASGRWSVLVLLCSLGSDPTVRISEKLGDVHEIVETEGVAVAPPLAFAIGPYDRHVVHRPFVRLVAPDRGLDVPVPKRMHRHVVLLLRRGCCCFGHTNSFGAFRSR